MRRGLILAAAAVLGLGVLVPAVLAAAPMPHSGRVLVSTQGDVTIPAGDEADVIVVVQGNADIRGDVNTLVVVDGSANLAGAHLETLVAVRSQVEVGDGTVIYGELKSLDATIHQTGNVEIQGGITNLAEDFLAIGAVLAPALMLLWLGIGLATIAAALLLAGLAARQVREAERLISREPAMTGAAGLLGMILIPAVAIVLFATLIGAPLAFGVLFQGLPLIAFAGYLVAAIWIGDWILRRAGPRPEGERPYLAAVLGVVVLTVIGLIPVLGLVVAIASLFGFGAVIRMAIRTLRGAPGPIIPVARPVAAATGA